MAFLSKFCKTLSITIAIGEEIFKKKFSRPLASGKSVRFPTNSPCAELGF